eukprot:gene13849-16329_t
MMHDAEARPVKPLFGNFVAVRGLGGYKSLHALDLDFERRQAKCRTLDVVHTATLDNEVSGWSARVETAFKLLCESDPSLRSLTSARGFELVVEIYENHAFLGSYYAADKRCLVDASWLATLGDRENERVMALLLKYWIECTRAENSSNPHREALHMLLGYVQVLEAHEREALLQTLDDASKACKYDSSALLATLIRDIIELSHAAKEDLTAAGLPVTVDSATLETAIFDASTERGEALLALRDRRDSRVSWYLGHILIDLPYDRTAMRRALEIEDTTARRDASYQVVRAADAVVEAENARRVCDQIRESWLADTEAVSPVIVVGRESRAFSNQATLFASSTYVSVGESIHAAIAAIVAAASEAAFDAQFARLVKAPQWAGPDVATVVGKLRSAASHLGPVVGRLHALVAGVHDGRASQTQFEGALQHLREALAIVTAKSTAAVETCHRACLTRRAEGVRRRTDSSVADIFRALHALVDALYGRGNSSLWTAVYALEELVARASTSPVAFSVLLQRASATGGERFRANELEPKPEQEEVLQKLVRLGGAHLYMSPSSSWVQHATDVIEAVPLFIYERTIEVDGQHTTVFEVDQEGLEQTIRDLAEHWSINIRWTIVSEHCALAREVLVLASDKLSTQLAKRPATTTRHHAICQLLADSRDQVIAMAGFIEKEYDQLAEQVEEHVELAWQQSNFITRIEALRSILIGSESQHSSKCKDLVAKAKSFDIKTISKSTLEILEFLALKKQRSMPAFHLLTTEAPGLVEGFIQAVLEEEMTLKNIIEYYNLEKDVKDKMASYNKDLVLIGKKVVEEFSYQPIVEQYRTQMGINEDRAILRVVSDHVVIQQQVSTLSVLYEFDSLDAQVAGQHWSLAEAVQSEPKSVAAVMDDAITVAQLMLDGVAVVHKQNSNDQEFMALTSGADAAGVIEASTTYKQEQTNFVVCEARKVALDAIARKHPGLSLKERASKYHRTRSALAQTTARREVVAANSLHKHMSDPRLAYSCGVSMRDARADAVRPTGARKRYHFVYGPSRVNLGRDERRSVEIWPQFVGATDPLCARHAQAFYGLINFNPVVRTITAAENLKVSENQWTALVRAVRNVQALFVERLGVGDIEDLSYQFNQRGGLAAATHRESEGSMSGPTAGYCIPKDLLFKLFVVTHQDSRKLSHVGLPAHLHSHVVRLMVDIVAAQPSFATAGAWERWAAKEFLAAPLAARFGAQCADSLAPYFAKYIEITGGVVMLHIAKLAAILGAVGVPSPLVSWGRDLHAALWSAWAERKITLGGEQVNRSVVFPMTREIPESGKLAQRLNPNASTPSEESLRVHMFGVYKGDDDQKPPPDVRFAWVMRAFLIMSGHFEEVALSLDEEGQMLARLCWLGFRPTSNEPADLKLRRYLASHFLGIDDFDNKLHADVISSLMERFPPHTTVGDITITAVPGVDADDLLGFSAETLNLLGDEAAAAADLLRAKGISVDQMRANAVLHRKFIDEWIPLANLPPAEQTALKRAIGGRIHPLSLRLRGPGDNFLRDLQGQDVVVFSITHPQLLALNPAALRDLMLIGRPNSSLAAHDHVSQGRHRCWFEREVMLWYAACLAIDERGERITAWTDRRAHGRRAIYKAFGWGGDQYQPLLGTDLREEVFRQEARAIAAYDLLERVANSPPDVPLTSLIAEIESRLFGKGTVVSKSSPPPLHALQLQSEIELSIAYEQRVLLANRAKRRDRVIREALEALRDSPSAASINPISWLAIGGYLLLNGAPSRTIQRVLNVVYRAHNRLNDRGGANKVWAALDDHLVSCMVTPQLATSKMQMRDRKGKMFSVKASEEHVETAVTRRKELETQARRNAILKWRESGFLSLGAPQAHGDAPPNIAHVASTNIVAIRTCVNKLQSYLSADESQLEDVANVEAINQTIGQTFNLCARALISISQLYGDASGQINASISALVASQGREIDARAWDALVGTYEEFGAMNAIYDSASRSTDPQEWLTVAQTVSEVLAVVLLLEKTGHFISTPVRDLPEGIVWRALCEFFAKTIDDHYSEYTPWTFDPKRYPLFGRYFDAVGVMKADARESQYSLYWSAHRSLYTYIRTLIIQKTSASGHQNIDDILGQVQLGGDISSDRLQVQAIGASAPATSELLWRAYNQLREISFLKNDGFILPFVFTSLDASSADGLNAQARVNHAFLSPIGRTHYSRAQMEGPTLDDNLFITRDGAMQSLPNNRSILTITDAFFWLPESAFRHYLRLANLDVTACLDRAYSTKAMTPKGILVAARFNSPVPVGSVVTLHHHHLESILANAGYPTTDKSPFLYEMTYNKSLYPLIFNPAEKTHVLLPQETDWLQIETTSVLDTATDSVKAEKLVLDKIKERLEPFAREFPTVIVKGAAESGARNLSRFDLASETHDGIDSAALERAAQFILQVSKAQNVVIQRAIISSPLFWMSRGAIEHLVERQIADHGVAVELNRHPKDTVYGTLRVIMSTGMPSAPDRLVDPANWHASHPIALSSLQIATNVGRQGSLDMLSPDMINEKLRQRFVSRLQDAGRSVMSAIAAFGPSYWSAPTTLYGHTQAPYSKRFPNIKETDATGVPIWWPRYLMLDFIPEPVWARKSTGELVKSARLIDIVPHNIVANGPIFTLQDTHTGEEFEGEVVDVDFWQLEPNVVRNGQQPSVDWNKVGASDRIVMGNFLQVGHQPDSYVALGNVMLSSLLETANDLSETTRQRIVEQALDARMSEPLAPPTRLLDRPDQATLTRLARHNITFAVIVGKRALQTHHFYPFFASACSLPINVVGINDEWIDWTNKSAPRLTRLTILSPDANHIIEMPLDTTSSIKLSAAFLVELPNGEPGEETSSHAQLEHKLTMGGVTVLNRHKLVSERCDDKDWLRSRLSTLADASVLSNSPLVCIDTTECLTLQDARSMLDPIASSVTNNNTGIVIQPQRDTTEAEEVSYFPAINQQCLQRILDLGDMGYDQLIAAPFIQSIRTQKDDRPFIIRLNATKSLTTIAIVKAGSSHERVISPGIRGSKWARVHDVLGDLGQPILQSHWDQWTRIAQQILDLVGLPIVGIDMILGATLVPSILEVNARPGSLIMSEQLQFDTTNHLVSSVMCPPISDIFWVDTYRSAHQSLGQLTNALADTRLFNSLLSDRYTFGVSKQADAFVMQDRSTILQDLLNGALSAGFASDQPAVITASNGRDRVFMGHSDFQGLGGFTINANTLNEILCVAQFYNDPHYPGRIILTNANPSFHPCEFAIAEILTALEASKSSTLWSPSNWENYIKSCLAYILCVDNNYPSHVVSSLKGLAKQNLSIRLRFSANGQLGLPSTGGVSSSSALTGAFSLAFNSLLDWDLTFEQLASLDFGEYYLGKTGGASDKTAQLFAKKGQISVIGSFPERFIKTLAFPTDIVILMAESPIPRLSTQKGRVWLKKKVEEGYIINNTSEAVWKWAHSIMQSFGSRVFVEAVALIKDKLSSQNLDETMRITGLTSQQSQAIHLSLGGSDPNNPALLRELSANGAIEKYLPELRDDKYKRYSIIYKLLKIVPDSVEIDGVVMCMRKSVLYGLSELERGVEYQIIIKRLNDPLNKNTRMGDIRALMQVIKLAHDGDRQPLDYRDAFKPIDQPMIMAPTDNHLDSMIRSCLLTNNTAQPSALSSAELAFQPGSFQRSLPEIDELADRITDTFKGHAALRIAAAGLGGSVCVHVHQPHLKDVIALLQSHNYHLRQVEASCPTSVVFSPYGCHGSSGGGGGANANGTPPYSPVGSSSSSGTSGIYSAPHSPISPKVYYPKAHYPKHSLLQHDDNSALFGAMHLASPRSDDEGPKRKSSLSSIHFHGGTSGSHSISNSIGGTTNTTTSNVITTQIIISKLITQLIASPIT